MRAALFAIAALGWAAHAGAGQYKLSGEWPTGVGTQTAVMSQDNAPLCRAVERALSTSGDRSAPLTCQTPLATVSGGDLTGLKWTALPKDRMAPVAERLESLRRSAASRHGSAITSNALSAGIKRDIAAGELVISIAKIPARERSAGTVLVRYQRGRCTKKNWRNAGRIEFFSSDTEDLSRLVKIRGLGAPNDAFLFRKKLYFYAATKRAFDDTSGDKLARSQPAIYIFGMYDAANYVPACRLLYWENGLTRPSKERAGARPSQ